MPAAWTSLAVRLTHREIPQWVLGATLLLMAVLVAAALIIVGVGRWLKRPARPADTSSDELAHFRLLYEQGEFSREEYDRIRSRLVPRLRKELDVPAPPIAPTPPPAGSDRIQSEPPRA